MSQVAPDIPEAEDIGIGVCPEGHLHVDLFDKAGAIIAKFTLPADDAEVIALEIIKAVGVYRERVGDHIGHCAGQA